MNFINTVMRANNITDCRSFFFCKKACMTTMKWYVPPKGKSQKCSWDFAYLATNMYIGMQYTYIDDPNKQSLYQIH